MKHKEVILTGILLTVLALAVVAVAQPLVTRKWQDALAKPNYGWMTTFGYSDGSHLAYHIVTLMENDQKLNAKIAELEKQLAGLIKPVPDARDIEQYKDTVKRMNDALSDPNVPDPNEVTK